METKNSFKVSKGGYMKKQITMKTIQLLKMDGIKFTVDDLASSLNISKKTIYKNFKNKEELLKVVYFYIYDELLEESNQMVNGNYQLSKYLMIYFKALKFNSLKVINTYALNIDLLSFSKDKIETIWNNLVKILNENNSRLVNNQYLRQIIEGSLINFINIKDYKKACIALANILKEDEER